MTRTQLYDITIDASGVACTKGLDMDEKINVRLNMEQFKKLLGQGSVSKNPTTFLRGKRASLEPSSEWREEGGFITFSVTSNGLSGYDWINRFTMRGYSRVGFGGKKLLRSERFQSTSGVTSDVVIVKGALFSNVDRIVRNVREEVDEQRLIPPTLETACLIREKISDDAMRRMGLMFIVIMHEPVDQAEEILRLRRCLTINDDRWLDASTFGSGNAWNRETGFAFILNKRKTL